MNAQTAKGERTRAAILDEALRLVSKAGLDGLTIGTLAEATGMSKSGLFAHFGSREAPAVLLAHGWGGQAVQLRAFVFPLLRAVTQAAAGFVQ